MPVHVDKIRPCMVALVALQGCVAGRSAPPQQPIPEQPMLERSAVVTDEELQPGLDAERLLRVQVSPEFWQTTAVHALFYSDGTLQVEERWRDRTYRPSGKLSADELERLSRDLPHLESCRRPPLGPDEVEKPIHSGGSVTFENLKQPSRNLVQFYPAETDHRPECLSYETFVVGLIKQTLDAEHGRR